jgi:hypothetical protein
MKPLKSCFHRAMGWEGAKKVRVYFKKLYMWSCFAKRFTKMAPALPIKLFIKLKPPKNGFTSKVERAKRGHIKYPPEAHVCTAGTACMHHAINHTMTVPGKQQTRVEPSNPRWILLAPSWCQLDRVVIRSGLIVHNRTSCVAYISICS